MKIAILAGTGEEGLGLAMRFAKACEELCIVSRSVGRAVAYAHKVREVVGFGHVTGLPNDAAAEAADLVIVSVPYAGQRDTLTALAPLLAGKIVVSIVVPLQFGKGGPHAIRVAEGSAAEEAREAAPDARLVSGFHNLSATKLMDVEADLDCDVVVCSDDAEAKRTVMALAEQLRGVRALDGGPLAYSRYVEDLTALILALNRRYKAHASIKFTGIGSRQPAAGKREQT